jgi:cobalt-zinc-cadmium efflux system outer membrane protein
MKSLLLIPTLAFFAGCQACAPDLSPQVEAQVAAVASARTTPEVVPCVADVPAVVGPINLPVLWSLALANNPSLREAAADVEAARGQRIQAGLYPNPRIAYSEDNVGNNQAPAGALTVQATQEIVTAGKRGLDVAIAARGTGVASVALLGRKFDILTRIRRAYYDYQSWRYLLRINEEVVAALEQGVEITRRQVEETRTRPRADLLRSQALLKESQLNVAASRANLRAAWRQLAAEVGLPRLPMPEAVPDLAGQVPRWDEDAVLQRVLTAHTEIKQATLEAERARLEVERARAGAVPNIVVGGGYIHDSVDRVQGAVLSIETALPVWDRQQGRLYEAQARRARAQAVQKSVATRLSRDTAEAFGRYEAARQRVERLIAGVLPTLVESLEAVREGYRRGSALFTIADLLLAEQALNDARLRLAEARRALWLAVADLEGFMQLDVGEEFGAPACPPG